MVAPIFEPGNERGLLRQIANRLKFRGGISGRASASLSSPESWTFIQSRDGSFLASNAHYDPVTGQWNRYNTALPAAAVYPSPSPQGLFYLTAPAGANPIAWINSDPLGVVKSSFIAADQAVGAGVSAFLGSLALTPGTWFILGQLQILMGAGAATVESRIAYAGTGASAGGSVTASVAATWWASLRPSAVVVLAANTTFHVQGHANGAWTAKWLGPFIPNGTETGLMAWRIA